MGTRWAREVVPHPVQVGLPLPGEGWIETGSQGRFPPTAGYSAGRSNRTPPAGPPPPGARVAGVYAREKLADDLLCRLLPPALGDDAGKRCRPLLGSRLAVVCLGPVFGLIGRLDSAEHLIGDLWRVHLIGRHQPLPRAALGMGRRRENRLGPLLSAARAKLQAANLEHLFLWTRQARPPPENAMLPAVTPKRRAHGGRLIKQPGVGLLRFRAVGLHVDDARLRPQLNPDVCTRP